MASAEAQHLFTVADRDGAAILDIERGSISTLNATGAYVWARMQRGEAIESIVTDLSHDTGADAQTVDRDVREFVATLESNHIVCG